MHLTSLIIVSLSLITAVSPVVGQDISGVVLPFREVKVSSPVQSFITELKVREGARVKKGDLLAQLYVRREALEMERYEAALEKRKFENEGAKNLFADQLISEDEALASEIELRLARLQFKIAEEAVRLRQIRAPISGVVVERHYEAGEMVTVGEPLFKLVDISSVFVQVYVSMETARTLREGTTVRLSFPELGEDGPELQGTVDFVDPQVDPASGLLKVKVLASNEERMVKPGLRAQLQVGPDE
ncbi:MAG: efflux RND transporter periplasmic adaptor subunit [Verrucomicrobia bacterium]|jgi:RND family efflux transporter MFP subunit|nr:efflux RND transporter periplasmic adaptor subunit [Verrucomicrobiota bacterium]